MSGSKLFAATMPPMSPELWDRLKKAFPVIRPEPNVHTMDDIMHNAGEQKVIEWLRHHIQSSTVQGSYEIKSKSSTDTE